MRSLEFKQIVVDFQSTKQTWDTLNVPADLQEGLNMMAYKRPSIIQAVSIPAVMTKADTNFLFQAINGSGKTGAYGVPSLMKVDKAVKKTQVIILANTRELIRQIHSVLETFASGFGVSIVIGESKANIEGAQVLITVPGFLKNKLIERKKSLDLSELKMVVYDEADELFI